MRAISIERRALIVAFVENGGTHADAAQHFMTCTKTVQRCCRKARQGESLAPKPWPGRKRTFESEALRKDVEERPEATQKERAEVFGVSQPAIWKRLRQLEIKLKKKSCATPSGMNTCDVFSSCGWRPSP
jgi:transposase